MPFFYSDGRKNIPPRIVFKNRTGNRLPVLDETNCYRPVMRHSVMISWNTCVNPSCNVLMKLRTRNNFHQIMQPV